LHDDLVDMNPPPSLAILRERLARVREEQDVFTKVIIAAFDALRMALLDTNKKRLTLGCPVAYLGDQGDWHSTYVAVSVDADGNLGAVDEEGDVTGWEEIDNNVSADILAALPTKWFAAHDA
jgi:hypothetical protein